MSSPNPRLALARRALTRLGRRAGGTGGLFEALAEQSAEAAFVVDVDRNILSFNRRAEELTGMSREEVLGNNCITGFKCSTCLASCGVFRHGRLDDVELDIFRADGTAVRVRKNARVVRDRAGEVIGAVETFRPLDVAEESATPAEGWPPVDEVMGSLGRSVVVLDQGFRILRATPPFADLIGSTPEALVGRAASDMFGAELCGEEARFRQALTAGERREGWRAWLRRADDSSRPVSVTGAPLGEGTSAGRELRSARFVLVIRPEVDIHFTDDTAAVRDPVEFEGMVARSRSMKRVFQLVEHLRESDATVLITGRSGTGKELVARAIHRRSPRASQPFVAINCGALPENLLESELFGHARGAFTGAVRDKPGRFEVAGEGTVFLDEIGDLPVALQVKLLRVLQERSFERLGETRSRPFHARVVAATHQDLARAVAERRFREDLYYRLAVVPIVLPSLVERRDDLELLVLHVLERVGRQRGRALRLSPGAMRVLLSYEWPGNVRQLQNALEYATAVCEGQTIHPEDLPAEITGDGPPVGAASPSAPAVGRAPLEPLPASTAGQPLPQWPTREAIVEALARARYRRKEAAKLLGVGRTTLWRRMRELGIG